MLTRVQEVRRSVRKTETTVKESPRLQDSSNSSKQASPVSKFGTQLSLSENSLTKMLWTQDVDVIAMDEEDALNRKQQARTLVGRKKSYSTNSKSGNFLRLHALPLYNHNAFPYEPAI